METSAVVQRQVDAYNARDLDQFIACFAEDVRVIDLVKDEVVADGKTGLAQIYARTFMRDDVGVAITGRTMVGSIVVDCERVVANGLEVVAIYRVKQGLIDRLWLAPAS